jgi:NCAIR mutase (PurE)-related protein
MNASELHTLLEQLAGGEIDAATAHGRVLDALRARPYLDLGFARVDHHRSVRQGFPEVVLGVGKTPAQIARIATEIVRRGSTLLVTRATESAYAAVREQVPEAAYYPEARIIGFPQ